MILIGLSAARDSLTVVLDGLEMGMLRWLEGLRLSSGVDVRSVVFDFTGI